MTVRDEISSLLEEVRVRGMRAATYATEAQRRHQAEAIDMLVVQALKLIEAEWNALLCEIADAEKAANTRFQQGGPVSGGKQYRVGDRGPELFVRPREVEE